VQALSGQLDVVEREHAGRSELFEHGRGRRVDTSDLQANDQRVVNGRPFCKESRASGQIPRNAEECRLLLSVTHEHLQFSPQRLPGSPEAGLDGAGSDLEVTGDFGDRKAAEVVKQHGLSEVGRQSFERVGDDEATLDFLVPRALPQQAHGPRHPLEELALVAMVPHSFEMDVASYGEQPGDGMLDLLPFGQCAVGADEGLLAEVARLGGRGRARPQIAQHRPLCLLDECFEVERLTCGPGPRHRSPL